MTNNSPIMRILRIILVVILLVSSGMGVFPNMSDQALHDDEYLYMERGSIFYSKLFIENDLSDPVWRSYQALDQPLLGMYLYGAFTHLTLGISPMKAMELLEYQPNTEIGYFSSVNWISEINSTQLQSKYIPEKYNSAYAYIVHNRYLAACFGIATVLGLFLLGKTITQSYTIGLIAAFLLSQNQLFINESRHAMADISFLFTIIYGLYFIYKLTQNPRSLRPTWKAIIIGIWIGLATSVKLNGLMLWFILCGWLLFQSVVILRKNSDYRRVIVTSVIYILTVTFTAFITFTILNPYTWADPLTGILDMFRWRSEISQTMMDGLKPRDINKPLYTLSARYWAMIKYPMTMFNMGRAFSFSYTVDIFLLISGLYVIAKQNVIAKCNQWKYLLFVTILLFLIMGSYIKITFDRYFMPILPIVAIVESVGIFHIFSMLGLTNKKTQS